MRELLLLLLCVSQHSMTGQIHEGEPDHVASPADSGAEEYLVDEGPVWRFGAQRQYKMNHPKPGWRNWQTQRT